MTLAELMASPIGTTDIYLQQTVYKRRDGLTFVAQHRERIAGEHIRSHTFYGTSRADVLAKAEAYDRKIKEGRQLCENYISATQHDATSVMSLTDTENLKKTSAIQFQPRS